jgi:hypothetical protein
MATTMEMRKKMATPWTADNLTVQRDRYFLGWRRLRGNDAADNPLRDMAGTFSRRLRAYTKPQNGLRFDWKILKKQDCNDQLG